jgi:hypothetical protein
MLMNTEDVARCYTLPKTSPTEPALDWRQAHEDLSRLAMTRARLDWEEGCSLLRALRSGAYLHLGFGSFAEYVERLFGYKPRWTEERVRVAQALEGLPELSQALRDGAVTWSTVRELTRVATPDNEHAWLDVARAKTARQMEELVAGHRPGDEPTDPYDASLRKHVLRFEVSAETMATFREAMSKLRREASASIDDDAALLLLARQALGGPAGAGRANYQIAMTVCDQCGRGWQQGSGEPIEVGSEVVEMAHCDAQRLAPHVGGSRARQDVPPAVRREVFRRDAGRCVVPGCRHATFLDVHHLDPRSEGGRHDPDKLVVLCGPHHRAEHRGQLIIEGRVSTGLVFRHADGTRYGSMLDARAAGTYGDAFRALRALGFRETEARRALDDVRRQPTLDGASLDRVLRAALGTLSHHH